MKEADWSKAPAWAQYHWIDADGQASWGKTKPEKIATMFESIDGSCEIDITWEPDWEDSLEQRPIPLWKPKLGEVVFAYRKIDAYGLLIPYGVYPDNGKLIPLGIVDDYTYIHRLCAPSTLKVTDIDPGTRTYCPGFNGV